MSNRSYFVLCTEHRRRVDEWMRIQDKKVKQMQRIDDSCPSTANYGAIGAGYTYTFTPSNIGTFLSVRNVLTGINRLLHSSLSQVIRFDYLNH